MRKRLSRFRIYAISLIVWFSIVLAMGVVASNDFLIDSKDDILEFVNQNVPIKLDIDDIKLVFPFNINVNKIMVSTKDSKDEFLYVEYLQLVLNPFRYFIRNNVYDILYYVSSNDGTFYTKYFDLENIEKYINPTEESSEKKDTLSTVNEVLHILENKSIRVNDFELKYDKDGAHDFDLSMKTLEMYFTETKYVFDSTFNLPDKTKLVVSLDSSKSEYIAANTNDTLSIEKASLGLRASDSSGFLFDYGLDLSLTNSNLDLILHSNNNAQVTVSESNDISKEEDLITVAYNLKDKNLDFDLHNFMLTPKMLHKSINVIKDIKSTDLVNVIPVASIETEGDRFDEIMSYVGSFVYSRLNAKGYYKPDQHPYIDIASRTELKDLSIGPATLEAVYLDFHLEYTNNIVISDRFNFNIKDMANVQAKLYAPLDDIYMTKFSANLYDINVGEHQVSLDINLSPVFNRVNNSMAKLQIENVHYNQFYIKDESFDIIVNKKSKIIRVKNTTADDDIFAIDVYFKNSSNLLLSGRGLLPTAFINNLAGKNIIPPLVEVYASYDVQTVNEELKHDLSIYGERIIGLNKMFEVDTTLINKELFINSFAFNPDGEMPVKANGKIYESSPNNFVASLNVATPVGEYKPRAVVSRHADRVDIDIKTDDSSVVGSGFVSYDGAFNFEVHTTEALSVEGANIIANVYASKRAEQKDLNLNGDFDVRFSKENISFRAQSDFFLEKNKTIMLTNMVYQNLGYQLNGEGVCHIEESGAINVAFEFGKNQTNEGHILANMVLNADHINARIDTEKVPISAFYSSKKFDGYLTVNTAIVGSMKNPSVVLNKLELSEFDFAGERFNITAKAEYRNKEAKIDYVDILKYGSGDVYIAGQTIKIYDSVIGEERHKVNVDIKNWFAMSLFNAKIKYDMETDGFGTNIYKVVGSDLKINSRKIPNFSTIATYDSNRVTFINSSSHGLRGDIRFMSSSVAPNVDYIYDNKELLSAYGSARKDGVNMYLVSERLGLEIFEIFNVIFKKIDTYTGDFTFAKGSKNYTLYSHITGPLSSLSIEGRFVGRGRVQGQYFKDKFDDSTVDFAFNGKAFDINQLTLVRKKDGRGVVMVGGADFLNNSFENMTFHLTTVNEKGNDFLDADADFGIFKTIGLVKLELDFLGSIAIDPTIGGDVYIEKNELDFTISPTTRRYTSDIYGTAHRVNYDLTVHAISRVQASYYLLGDVILKDGSTLTVKNNLINGIELDGELEVERGTVYYLQNVYDVESGSMRFSGNDLDPVVNLNSSTKKRYVGNGTAYNVTLYMDIVNSRLSSLTGVTSSSSDAASATSSSAPVRFYTQPPLNAYQTALLAGVSTTDSRDVELLASSGSSLADSTDISDDDQLRNIAASYTDLLLRNVALRPAERFLRQHLGIDYFGVNTEIFDRMLFDRDSMTSENFDLNNFFSGTGAEIGLYVAGSDLFVTLGLSYETILTTVEEEFYGLVPDIGFEVNLLPKNKLVNLVFEYNITPFQVEQLEQTWKYDTSNQGQEFSIKVNHRF